MTRRAFLRLMLLSGIGAGGAAVYRLTEPVGFGNWFRWMLRGEFSRLAPMAQVGLSACHSYDADIQTALRAAWKNAGAPDLAGARVVLKPNLVESFGHHPSFTNPRVVQALIRYLRDDVRVNSVVVAEATTFRRDSESLLVETGYRDMLESERVEFVDLNYDDLVPVKPAGGFSRLAQLFLARTVVEADALISVPKLKTHHWTGTSGSLKNLFGIVPGIKYGWPKNTLHVHGIPAFLAELLDSLPAPHKVAVVDGIVGMQGDGPLLGGAVDLGAIVVGSDLLAVDATCARLMGIEPTQLDYLAFAAWAGLGQIERGRIDVRGASLDSLRKPFQQPPTARLAG